jgi:hypothetical protein
MVWGHSSDYDSGPTSNERVYLRTTDEESRYVGESMNLSATFTTSLRQHFTGSGVSARRERTGIRRAP